MASISRNDRYLCRNARGARYRFARNTPNYLPRFFCHPRLPDDMVVPGFFADKCSLRSMNKGGIRLDRRDKVMTEKR